MKLSRVVLWPAYWILAVALFFYLVFWTPYRLIQEGRESTKNLNARIDQPPRHIDVETMRLLGNISKKNVSHFVNFERVKPEGTIRVCALGDSHTNGNEVGEREDFPSQLQAVFNHHGYHRVQVINFGSGWHGFGQVYVMWKRITTGFDCDFVLLLPMHFWHGRDTTFNHTKGALPSYLHARLIPDGDGLRLLAPIGNSGQERRDNYLRAIPRAFYRLYDRHPLSIIDALLPSGRQIENPFYYDTRSSREEVQEIYPRIIRDIANHESQLLVLFRNEHRRMFPWLTARLQDRVGTAFLSSPWDFPYLAPADHPSAWGNELVAKTFFRMLTGSADTELVRVVANDISTSGEGESRPLHSYTEAWLEYGENGRGLFVAEANRKQDNPDQFLYTFRQSQTTALLALAPEGGIAQGCLLPLSEMPTVGSELVFVPSGNAGKHRTIGYIDQPQPDVALFTVNAPAPGIADCPGEFSTGLELGGGANGRYMIDGQTVAKIHHRVLTPILGELLVVRDDGHRTDVGIVHKPQQVDLLLRLEDGSEQRYPLMRLQPKKTIAIDYRHRPARIIRVIDGQARVVPAVYSSAVSKIK
jgi:hypothetical protein